MFKFKKATAALAVSAIAASTMAISAFADVRNYDFILFPRAGLPRVVTERKLKEDHSDAIVNLKGGLVNDYVTFRIRTPGTYSEEATDFKDLNKYGKEPFKYRSGYGYYGDYYVLAASYDEGQSRTGAYVNGIWAP